MRNIAFLILTALLWGSSAAAKKSPPAPGKSMRAFLGAWKCKALEKQSSERVGIWFELYTPGRHWLVAQKLKLKPSLCPKKKSCVVMWLVQRQKRSTRRAVALIYAEAQGFTRIWRNDQGQTYRSSSTGLWEKRRWRWKTSLQRSGVPHQTIETITRKGRRLQIQHTTIPKKGKLPQKGTPHKSPPFSCRR